MEQEYKKPDVSVIIPARNEEAYIEKTIRAVLAQEFARDAYEIIVVDNASKDRTAAIARAFKEVRVVREEREGVQHARERGRKEARGRVLAFLDADTRPPFGWLSQGMKFCSRDGVVAVSGPCNFYDVGRIAHFFASVFFDYRAWHFIFHTVLRRCGVIAGGNFFVRASALADIGGFDCSIDFYGDDTDTGRRLLRAGWVLYRKEILVETSARRFRQLGFMRTLWLYAVNFFWIILKGRPYSQA